MDPSFQQKTKKVGGNSWSSKSSLQVSTLGPLPSAEKFRTAQLFATRFLKKETAAAEVVPGKHSAP